jgi:hypothetical protein
MMKLELLMALVFGAARQKPMPSEALFHGFVIFNGYTGTNAIF